MLDEQQLRQFAAEGYLVVSGVVPEDRLGAVDDEIDVLLLDSPPPADLVGRHDYFLPPDRLPKADAALRHSGALDLARQLVAPYTIDYGLDHIQLALSFPVLSHRPGGPHIDGHGGDRDRPDSFTLLAGIYLVDDPGPDGGNLWVWPGSHLVHAELFRRRGPDVLLANGGHVTLLEDPPAVGPGRPVTAQRGDLLLAHFLLGHNWSGNQSERTRRVAYYRLSTEGHRGRWPETFLDPWAEFAPVRAS